MFDLFDAPHQFEPLMPSAAKLEPLLAQAHDLSISATTLAGLPMAQALRGLLWARKAITCTFA
jgi:hypothetical protein